MTTTWRLKSGADKRIRSGHPWVFSNELMGSPKGHLPGHAVELLDAKGNFISWGYGNPHSLIAFRALSFLKDDNIQSKDFYVKKLLNAWKARKFLGYLGSFRLCFGESDFLPGLVVDRYLVEKNSKICRVFATQILTYGMSIQLQKIDEIFHSLVSELNRAQIDDVKWENTAIVIRNDVNIRKLEGLSVDEPKVIKAVADLDLSKADILLNSVTDSGAIKMQCDLIDGQKTGFFLDQTHNIKLASENIRHWIMGKEKQSIRILDLCCYVGHWSTQLANLIKSYGCEVEVTLVDVSEAALNFAKLNSERAGAQVIVEKRDVLKDLETLPNRYYDIVIADPPAFIKAKKDIPTGKHAYLKMNTRAFAMVKENGFVVSCSCSGLLTEEDFRDVLRKSIQRSGLVARNICRGGHAGDHPTQMFFPEGFYLKMFMHQT